MRRSREEAAEEPGLAARARGRRYHSRAASAARRRLDLDIAFRRPGRQETGSTPWAQ